MGKEIKVEIVLSLNILNPWTSQAPSHFSWTFQAFLWFFLQLQDGSTREKRADLRSPCRNSTSTTSRRALPGPQWCRCDQTSPSNLMFCNFRWENQWQNNAKNPVRLEEIEIATVKHCKCLAKGQILDGSQEKKRNFLETVPFPSCMQWNGEEIQKAFRYAWHARRFTELYHLVLAGFWLYRIFRYDVWNILTYDINL